MPFVRNHLYLTLHWVPSGAPLETGQCGIRFDSQAAATQALVDSCKSPVLTFWNSVNTNIGPDFVLKYLRLARIGTDGKYIPGSVAFDATISSGGAGGGTGNTYPLQVASAATLVTAVPRGQAAKGRMFLPPLASALSTDYRYPQATADARSATLATMITALNVLMGGPAAVLSKGTTRSSVGAVQAVTGVQHGRRPDVQRRRGKGVTELYGTKSNVT